MRAQRLRAALLLLLAVAARAAVRATSPHKALLGADRSPLLSQGVDDAFSEELLLRPLADGHVLAHFHFRSASRGGSPAAHGRGFPRAVAQLLWASNASDFAVSLSRGAWDAEAWGAAPLAAPQGAALTARWQSEAEAESAWRPLAHGLGGALCASLGALADAAAGGTPGASLLRPGGGAARHAALGREPVCTENLTPWLKGLPCGDAAGLAALLARRGAVAGARHVSMTLSARRTAQDAAVATHTLTLVLRPDAARPGALAAALGGARLQGACAAADTSLLHIALPAALPAAPQPAGAHRRSGMGGEAVWSYDLRSLREGESLEPSISESESRDGGARLPLGVPRWAAPAGWRVSAHLTGRGDAHGGLVLEAYQTGEGLIPPGGNSEGNATLRLLQLLPPACRVWWHTLALRLDGAPADLAAALAEAPRVAPHGTGARRTHAALLDIALALPPGTRSARLAMRFSTAFLRLDELPPDGQRGVDIPPARAAITVRSPAHSPASTNLDACDAEATPLLCAVLSGTPCDVAKMTVGDGGISVFVGYSGGLLLTLPSPDASMPFNVICFVCTALALLHTGVLGAATRRPRHEKRAADADDVIAAAIKAAGPPKGLRARLRAKLGRS